MKSEAEKTRFRLNRARINPILESGGIGIETENTGSIRGISGL